MFDNHVLYLTAQCYNMLKMSGLIVNGTDHDMFVGLKTRNVTQKVPVKVIPKAQLPAGLEMMMTDQGVPHV